jgi:lipopolysaccharide transport system permease protein
VTTEAAGAGEKDPGCRADCISLVPPTRWLELDLALLWRYRTVLWFLAIRDIKVRYKQTVLGASWAILQPLLSMIVFSAFFGHLAKIPSNGLPYPLFTLCGLLPWQLFAYALSQSSNSVVAEQHLVAKIYFPRLLIPLASVVSGLLDFAIAFGLFLVVLAYYAARGFPVHLGWTLLSLPVWALATVVVALSVGLWLAALNVRYRDARYTVPFMTQIWLFLTPVVYPSTLVPGGWRLIYALNPMAGIVEGFRWVLLGGPWPGEMLWVSGTVTVVLFLGGLHYFLQTEQSFADLI